MATVTFDRDIVKGMIEDAIGFCVAKTRLDDREEVVQAVQNAECCVCGYVRHGLAKALAAYLGSTDNTVKTIYTYEPEYGTNADEPLPDNSGSPGINLIAWVSRKSAALEAVVASANKAIANECRELACAKTSDTCFEVDVTLVDDDEVQRRSGYGALVKSFYVRPIQIWQRPAT